MTVVMNQFAMTTLRIMISFFLIVLCLLAFSGFAFAQEDATPIAIDQNIFGELTADTTAARYAVTASGGESASIQVLALSEGFAPRFRVINPAGVEMLVVANPNGVNSLVGNASFADAGVYLIEITGENGTLGQYALSLQPGAALPEAIDLVVDQLLSDVVGSQTPIRVYHFNTATDPLLLTILSDEADSGVLVSLYNEDAGKTIATNDAGVSGVVYRFPPQPHSYQVEVRTSGEAGDTAYTICLGNCGSGLLAGEATAESELATAACSVTSNAGTAVNVRGGPGTQYAVIGNLAAGDSLPVLGQLAGGGWYPVNANGQTGWVAASVTRLDGNCGSLPVVAAPVGAQLAPTQPPAPTQPTSGSTPTNTPTTAPTMTATTALLPDLTIIITGYHVDLDKELAAAISYTVSNIGSAQSEATGIMFCSGTYCDDLVSTGVLLPGEGFSGTVTFRHTADPNAAFNQATATVDYGNFIMESNEGNNIATAYE
jgi:hypothetical protein